MEQAANEFACLEMCQSDPECEWLTFNGETNSCKLLKNCQKLNEEACPNCLTSPQDCIRDEPVCFVVGDCNGQYIDTYYSPSAEDCLERCNSTDKCEWFTFDTISVVPSCFLLSDCQYIDPSCNTCISGERRCIDSRSSVT